MTEIARLYRGVCCFYADPKWKEEDRQYRKLDGLVKKWHAKPTPGGWHVINARAVHVVKLQDGTEVKETRILNLNVCKAHGEEIFAKALEGLTEKEDYNLYEVESGLTKIATAHRLEQ